MLAPSIEAINTLTQSYYQTRNRQHHRLLIVVGLFKYKIKYRHDYAQEGGFADILRECCCDNDIKSAWERACGRLRALPYCRAEESELMLSLGRSLGTSDISGQLSLIGLHSEKLNALRKSAYATVPPKMPLGALEADFDALHKQSKAEMPPRQVWFSFTIPPNGGYQ